MSYYYASLKFKEGNEKATDIIVSEIEILYKEINANNKKYSSSYYRDKYKNKSEDYNINLNYLYLFVDRDDLFTDMLFNKLYKNKTIFSLVANQFIIEIFKNKDPSLIEYLFEHKYYQLFSLKPRSLDNSYYSSPWLDIVRKFDDAKLNHLLEQWIRHWVPKNHSLVECLSIPSIEEIKLYIKKSKSLNKPMFDVLRRSAEYGGYISCLIDLGALSPDGKEVRHISNSSVFLDIKNKVLDNEINFDIIDVPLLELEA